MSYNRNPRLEMGIINQLLTLYQNQVNLYDFGFLMLSHQIIQRQSPEYLVLDVPQSVIEPMHLVLLNLS